MASKAAVKPWVSIILISDGLKCKASGINELSELARRQYSRNSEKADPSAALHPSEQRPLAGDPGLRNDNQTGSRHVFPLHNNLPCKRMGRQGQARGPRSCGSLS